MDGRVRVRVPVVWMDGWMGDDDADDDDADDDDADVCGCVGMCMEWVRKAGE